jgi:hypothetical protein
MKTAAGLLTLVIFVASPILSVILLAAGCAQPWQILGVMCGHNSPLSLMLFSVIGWFVLGCIAVIFTSLKDAPWRK